MGQKVKPRTFRLGVKYNDETLLFKPITSLSNKDRCGHKYELSNSNSPRIYGKQLNSVRALSKHLEEIVTYLGRLTNRIQISSARGDIRLMMEVYNPVDPRDREVTEGGKVPTSKQIERLTLGVIRLVKLYETYFNSTITVNIICRNDKLRDEKYSNIITIRCKNKTKLRQKLISQDGRAGVLVLASIIPVAERLTKVIAIQLEDSRKHSDVIAQRRDMMNRMDNSDLGRIDYASIISGKLDNRGGGYRGYRVITKGTIDGSRRTRKEVIMKGVRPLSTITAPISYAYKQAKTKTGTRGVHVMYCY